MFKRMILKKILIIFRNYFFDPWDMLKRWAGLYFFTRNAVCYLRKQVHGSFGFDLRQIYYRTYDRFSAAGSVPEHYFLQDIWVASYVHNMGIKYIVDIGSRLDGFIAHILPFCEVNFVDIRPLHVVTGNLKFIHGSITDLPFESDSVASVSSLHVIEHIGLGRYGDSVDTEGHVKAALEMQRVLQPGGVLLLGTVVGKERLCFDAHRIFDPDTIAAMFCGLNLEKFCLIDDEGKLVIEDATFASARSCNYGCGIFIFRKQPNSQNGKLNHGTYI